MIFMVPVSSQPKLKANYEVPVSHILVVEA